MSRSYGSTANSQDPYSAWGPNGKQQEGQPLMSDQQPPPMVDPQQQQYSADPAAYDPRPKNWPRCRPIIHHNIEGEIPPHHIKLIRQAYLGWYFHIVALIFNFICMLGSIIKGEVVASFFYALIAMVVGIPISFWVYWMLYSSIRKASGFFFCIWFVVFVLQIASEIFFAIGIDGYGTAGVIMVLVSFDAQNTTLGILFLVATILWVLVTLYNVYVFNKARIAWNSLGGAEAARKDFTNQAAQAAYDNRDTIKQVAVENKDTIVQFAKDNKETIARVAVENKDVLIENRQVVTQVFLDQNKTSHV